MPRLSHHRYDAELRAETARFAAAVREADPAQPVPTCPGAGVETGPGGSYP